MKRMSYTGAAVLRLMLVMGACVSFAAALTGYKPLGPDGGSIAQLGFIFLSLVMLTFGERKGPE